MVMCLLHRPPQRGGQLSVRAFPPGPCFTVSGYGRQGSLVADITLERDPAFAAWKRSPGHYSGNDMRCVPEKLPERNERYAPSCSSLEKIGEQCGTGDAFGLCVYGQDIQAFGFDLRKQELVIVGGGDAVLVDSLVIGRQRDGDLRLQENIVSHDRPEDAVAPAVAVIHKWEFCLCQQDAIRALPARYGRAGRRSACYVGEHVEALAKDKTDILLSHGIDVGLPCLMVPCVQTDFVATPGGDANMGSQLLSDDGARPEDAPEDDIPAVKARSPCPQHLRKKCRAEQPPEMTTHVVWADREEERCLDCVLIEKSAESRDAESRPPERVNINPEADFCCHIYLPANTTVRSFWYSTAVVIAYLCFTRFDEFPDEEIQRLLNGVIQHYDRVPAEQLPGVPDAWFTVLHILVSSAIVRGAFEDTETGKRRELGSQRVFLKFLKQHFCKLLDACLVLRVAYVYYAAVAVVVLVLYYAEEGLNAIGNIREAALLEAAVDELNGRALQDVENELCDGSRAADAGALEAVELRPYPIERAEECELQALFCAIGPDDAVQKLLGAGVYPSLHADGPQDETGIVFVEIRVVTHAVNLRCRGEDYASLILDAIPDDAEILFEVELEDP